MKVISVNIGEKQTVTWRGKSVDTGIFKYPTDKITLGATDVARDHVVDRRFHGGIDKACYLYDADTYSHWKEKYPNLEWNWGMFGENVTLADLDESNVFIGSRYQLGTALVEVSQPRQPCFKLGIRFGTQKILKQFIQHGRPGVYVRVLKPGEVKPGDTMTLLEKGSNISIQDVFLLLYGLHPNPGLTHEASGLPNLAASARKNLSKSIK